MCFQWLKNRLEYIRFAEKRGRYPRDMNDERLFPFSHTNSLCIWHRAIKRARLDERDSTTGRYKIHPHVIRKFFRTKLARAIPVDVVEALMGHEGYLSAAHHRYSL
jgi:integrase